VTTRPLFATIGLLALAACAAPVPDSGVGFGDYTSYAAQREGALTGAQSLPAPAAVSATPLPPGGIPATDLAAAGIGTAPLGAPLASPLTASPAPLGAAAVNDPLRTAGVQASPANAIPPGMAPNAISDEQNFDAVATRESIESDAARRAQQAAQYQVVQPTALPQAPSSTGPNIVEYALAAPNRKGQPWYSRFVWAGMNYERNCASYRSADEAQQAFLERGGPERDRLGIDPDGDGFACAWDPAPFLAAVGRS
jgi:hypothetical protein